jgi:hypothetical protein
MHHGGIASHAVALCFILARIVVGSHVSLFVWGFGHLQGNNIETKHDTDEEIFSEAVLSLCTTLAAHAFKMSLIGFHLKMPESKRF